MVWDCVGLGWDGEWVAWRNGSPSVGGMLVTLLHGVFLLFFFAILHYTFT